MPTFNIPQNSHWLKSISQHSVLPFPFLSISGFSKKTNICIHRLEPSHKHMFLSKPIKTEKRKNTILYIFL